MGVMRTQSAGQREQRIEADAWAMIGSLFTDQKIVWVSYDEGHARAVLARVKEIVER